VLGRYLVLVVLVVTFLAKVNFLCETVHIPFLVLALLALYELCLLMLLLPKGELDQVVGKSLHFLENLQPMTVYLILVSAFLINHRVKALGRTELLGLSLWSDHTRVTLARTHLYYQQFMVLLSVLYRLLVKPIDLSDDKFVPTFLGRYLEPFLTHPLNPVGPVVLGLDINF
jgi:hypothetical protein